ncbi:hypothetical protein EWM64_g1190 [Hericium alpestre]|uniref:Major facilitator superfamily (MFS) profile domain-containing protein n=1 Tax=Hericium alpestre TaxID=135208 RepID=A0A4Z0A6Y3_9AGAM|nr:hypothetical protein EWM64_g1190 [Hericium alpestre]
MSIEIDTKSKKGPIVDIEDIPAPTGSNYRPDVDTSGVDERKLMWKIDLRLIPWLALLYLMNFLDRGSIGNARTLHGVAHNYGDLIALRFVLGLAEAGLYPGIVFYITCWYKRFELGTRVAAFFSSATVAGAFSGLLAAAIHNMDGIGGKPGWAWIFILEGLFTVLIAVASFWIVQDFPDTAKFLTEPERVFVVRRLQDDMQFSAGGEKFKMKYVWDALTDWKTYIAMGIYMGFDGPLFAFSLFTPTILNQLGYGTTASNLLAWVSSNVEGSYKRSAVFGMAIGFGNLNGAVSSNIYRSQDKPWYSLGHGIILAYIAIGWLCSLLYIFVLRHENAARDRGERDEEILGEDNKNADGERNGRFESVETARQEKGDMWSGFRYVL